jgi:prepilin peptidase CpaA
MLQGWGPSVGLVLAGAALAILCTAAAHDILARTVPNWMPIVLAVIGIAESVLAGRLVVSLLSGVLVFILSGLCWRRGWLGGGDVKLLGAASIAVPPIAVAPFIAAVAISGGVLALLYLTLGKLIPAAAPRRSIGRPVGLLARTVRLERWRLSRGGPLPYAVAIAAGGMFVLL